MKASSLISVLCAAHWSWKVRPDPYERRGGIMLVAPGGHGKTSVLTRIKEEMPKILFLSDLTTRQAVALRSKIVEGKIYTLVVDEMEKLYQRMDSTAMNVEGTLQALIEQGFSDMPGDTPTQDCMPAKCMVIANCTEGFYVRKCSNSWSDAFLRRWLIVKFRLEDPDIYGNAIEEWKRVEIKDGKMFHVPFDWIPYSVDRLEAKEMRHWLSMANRDDKTPQQLLHKILSVLKWRYPEKGAGFEILKDFSESLKVKGASLSL